MKKKYSTKTHKTFYPDEVMKLNSQSTQCWMIKFRIKLIEQIKRKFKSKQIKLVEIFWLQIKKKCNKKVNYNF